MIKGIFFDAADVFYFRHESAAEYALRILKQKGYPAEISGEDLEHQKALHTQATDGRVSHEMYWDQFMLMHGVTDSDERRALVGQIAEHSHEVVAVPGGREAMSGLKERGFVLGIVTDTIYPLEWKMSWLAKVGVAQFMDVASCSTVLGTHKPNPEIYLDALRQARLTPSEAAFVAHSSEELEGARRVGMATVAVNYDPDAKADYYAKSLLDLLNVPIFQRK